MCWRCAQIQGIKLMVRWLLGVKNNQSKSGNSTLRMLTAILHSDGDLTEQGKMRWATRVSMAGSRGGPRPHGA